MVEYSWWDGGNLTDVLTKPKKEPKNVYHNATSIGLRLDYSCLDTLDAILAWIVLCSAGFDERHRLDRWVTYVAAHGCATWSLAGTGSVVRSLCRAFSFILAKASTAHHCLFHCCWTLWFGLTELDPVFLFVLAGLYPQVFMLPPLHGKILGAFLLTALSAWRQVMLAGGIDGNLFLMLAAAVSGIIMGLFIYAIVEQSQQRQLLIGELEGTRQALAAAEKQAGIMEERQRLAGEIHDTLAQGFTSIVMHLEAAEAAFPDELSTLHHYLNQARRTARENLAEARRVLWALQPATLDRVSLAEALTHLVTRWSAENVVRGLATVTGTPQFLRPEIEVTLLRAAQEALANARKHARASQVALTLSYMDDMVILDIQDDGIGFDQAYLCVSPVGQPIGGFGLKALRERVQQLGGTLSIESAPGKGTTIAVALPAMSKEALSLR